MRLAIKATSVMPTATMTNVMGSVGPTPNS